MQASLGSKLTGTLFALALALAAAMVPAAAQNEPPEGYGPGYGMGPGMMGGYGPGYGMMGGYGGYGMGPGMMRGYGQGYGMGPGMMGGYGMGMMGSGMMMGYGGYDALDLSDAQRTKIDKILDTERKQHWAVMGGLMDARSKLRELYEFDQPNPNKVGAAYGDIAKMQRQLIESGVRTHNQIWNILTKEQRDELRQWRHHGWTYGRGPRRPGPGPGPGPMEPGSMMRR